MRPNPDRLTTGAARSLAVLVLGVLGLAACSEGGGGSSPTAPPPPPAAAGSASVSGQVTGVSGSAAGTVGAAGIGVTVRIQGTSLSTTTDAAGRFDLGGVPAGDQVVLFETAAATAPLPIHGIESGELIDLVVALDGSTVQVQSMSRSKGGEDPPELTLEFQPDTWNVNWANSSGTVSALIRGEGFGDVDLDSIVLIGSDPGAAPLEPTRAERRGNHVRAFFAKSAAIGVLDDPRPGEVHEVTIELTAGGGEPFTLTATVRIVGPNPPDEEEPEEPGPVDLTVAMQPDSWNTNWSRSGGTVTALIRGNGFEDVDLDSIVLIGTDPEADPLVPTRVDRQGNHVRAFFAKSDAIDLLETPAPGEVHTLTVELTVAGEPVTLTTDVRVVGPPA